MTGLYWQTYGEGKQDLVLLHGWGLNAEVWRCIIPRLSTHFRLHLVDLPGYGRSHELGEMSLPEMAQCVMNAAPPQAWWLGWSLGGVVAMEAALQQPQRVSALLTVASSPCFAADEPWPGIRPEVLTNFQQQLSEDFQRTVERFLALQTLGTDSARQDARQLKAVVLEQPTPDIAVLNTGLQMLRHVDFRQSLMSINCPVLRIYGYLDGLVPRKVAGLLDTLWPQSHSVIMPHAAHAPFISHPDAFSDELIQFLSAQHQ